jgi:ATP-dependent DNA ligase
MSLENQQGFMSFVESVGVMKPNTVKKDDEKAKKKLDKLLDDPNYAIEEKIDGCHYKMIGYRFFSIDNVEKTNNFPHLRDFFKKLSMYNLILDGEIHYPGKTSQYATHVTGPAPQGAIDFQEQNGYIHYTIFDILRTPKANWTIRNPYIERRKLLEFFYNNFVKGTEMEEYIHIVPMTVENKRQFLQEILESGREGGVLKKLDSLYYMGKRPMWQWMKIKQEDDVDLVIMGFEPPKMEYTGSNLDNWPYWKEVNGVMRPVTKFYYYGWIGSVVLGAYVNGKLTQICTASGMDETLRKDMSENPDKYLGRVARVIFMERTADGYPRHPVFKNLHEDKRPEDCIWEF